MFNLGIKEIVVLGVYAYAMMYVLKREDMPQKLALSAVVLYFLVGTDGFSLKEAGDKIKEDIKKFQDVSNIDTNTVGKSSLDSRGGGMMGPKLPGKDNQMPYDGLCLKTGNTEYWMKSPDDTPFLPNETLYTYLGSEGPIKMKISDQSALSGPPVDGVEGSPTKMFMFANNRSSPACCPSNFSTSTGCVCTTKHQRQYVASRGGNN